MKPVNGAITASESVEPSSDMVDAAREKIVRKSKTMLKQSLQIHEKKKDLKKKKK